MWSIQLKSGPDEGAWLWSDFDLDPWETKDSPYYGAALGALATGLAPGDYQSRPEIQRNVAALTAYLRAEQRNTPLHNRLFLLWASSKLRDCARRIRQGRRFWRSSGANRKPTAAGHWHRSVLGISTTRRRLRLAPIAMRPRWLRSPWNRPGVKASDPVLSQRAGMAADSSECRWLLGRPSR